MPKRNADTIKHDPSETKDISVSIGKIKKNSQVTVNDTGWSEEEKERMRKSGYDGVDMVNAWYS